MQIIYSDQAKNDIDEIYDYIYVENPFAAKKIIQELKVTIEKLMDFSELGTVSRLHELALKDIRILPHRNYIILYRIDHTENIVYVYHIVHGARDYIRLF